MADEAAPAFTRQALHVPGHATLPCLTALNWQPKIQSGKRIHFKWVNASRSENATVKIRLAACRI